MQVDLSEEEMQLIKGMMGTASLAPQGVPGGSIIPTMRLMLAILDKLEAAVARGGAP